MTPRRLPSITPHQAASSSVCSTQTSQREIGPLSYAGISSCRSQVMPSKTTKPLTFALAFAMFATGCDTWNHCDPETDKPYCKDNVAWRCTPLPTEDAGYDWTSTPCGEYRSSSNSNFRYGSQCAIVKNAQDHDTAMCVEESVRQTECFRKDICKDNTSCMLSQRSVCIDNACFQCLFGYRTGVHGDGFCCED